MKQLKHSSKAGFALLMASLVASVLLAIGTVIANITTKQVALSGTARESLNALFAADTGVECALYLDFRYNSPTAATFAPSQTTCNNQVLTICDTASPGCGSETNPPGGGIWNWKKFKLNLVAGDDSAACAIVFVGKNEPSSGQIKTLIRARGYNVCGSFSRKVERALQVEY